MAIHTIESTLSCDKDSSSKNLPIIGILTGSIPLFIDLDIYYQLPKVAKEKGKKKLAAPRTPEELKAMHTERSRRWREKNPNYYKDYYASVGRKRSRKVSTAKSANPI